ncbi:GntR family transcriptional regulator [Streptomyces sp. NPDC014894]|uniref:GntR family transcriptional regulator n=1 Tax=Streptomyces sp. NPDC014894 TaxID=3364931 RepID=UPI003700D488
MYARRGGVWIVVAAFRPCGREEPFPAFRCERCRLCGAEDLPRLYGARSRPWAGPGVGGGGGGVPRTRRAPYMRVRDALIAAIEAGTYGPGDRIPSEIELCATHKVAPMTARRVRLPGRRVAATEPRPSWSATLTDGAGPRVRASRAALSLSSPTHRPCAGRPRGRYTPFRPFPRLGPRGDGTGP